MENIKKGDVVLPKSDEDYKKFYFPKEAVVLIIEEGLNEGDYTITFTPEEGNKDRKNYVYLLSVKEKSIALIRFFAKVIYSISHISNEVSKKISQKRLFQTPC